eukprot:gene24701-10336_t
MPEAKTDGSDKHGGKKGLEDMEVDEDTAAGAPKSNAAVHSTTAEAPKSDAAIHCSTAPNSTEALNQTAAPELELEAAPEGPSAMLAGGSSTMPVASTSPAGDSSTMQVASTRPADGSGTVPVASTTPAGGSGTMPVASTLPAGGSREGDQQQTNDVQGTTEPAAASCKGTDDGTRQDASPVPELRSAAVGDGVQVGGGATTSLPLSPMGEGATARDDYVATKEGELPKNKEQPANGTGSSPLDAEETVEAGMVKADEGVQANQSPAMAPTPMEES